MYTSRTDPADDPELAASTQMKLAQLLKLVEAALTESLPDRYWVVAEIAELKLSPRGYTHFTLVEKNADTLVAKVPGVMWRPATQSVLPRFRASTGAALAVGMGVLLRVSVQFHIAYGLQLEIHDIDPTYTLGEMARQRREVLERLERENLLRLNKSLPFPLAPCRIAVISSQTAAGYEDFVHQITTNAYGYAIRHELFVSLMQGAGAAAGVVDALSRIRKRVEYFDVVVMIRGGGSSVDLSCFDSYAISAAIAGFPIPVITGIGHERDETVADCCAHTRAKTPTAAAELLIGAIKAFDDRLERAALALAASARRRMTDEECRIQAAVRVVGLRAAGLADSHKNRLERAAADLRSNTVRLLERAADKLEHTATSVRLLDPINVLRRGYSITYNEQGIVSRPADAASGGSLTTRIIGGTIRSVVTAIQNEPEEQPES